MALSPPESTPALPWPLKNQSQLRAGRRTTEDAQRHWVTIAEAWPSQAPASYYQAGRGALWSRELETMRRYTDAFEATGFHAPVVDARRATLLAVLPPSKAEIAKRSRAI